MKNITFIYAGAGSGKTHTLTEKLTKWVKEHRGEANQIMFTTFTKKAANEIKERAQAKLLENQLFDEAQQLNEAFIGTVHSVGYQFIKKYWYLLGITPEITEISDNEKELFFTTSIALVPTDEELKKINNLSRNFDFTDGFYNSYNPNKWQGDVKSLVDKSLTNQIDLINDTNSLNNSVAQAKSIFKGTLKESEIKSIIEHNSSVLLSNELSINAYVTAIDLKIELDSIIARKLEVKDLHLIEKFQKAVMGAYGAAKYASIKEQFILLDLSKADVFQKNYIEYTTLIFTLASRSIENYRSHKQNYGYVDFTDMEVYFLELLDHEIVKKEIAETLQLVMVDEFQDSNPIQLSIFIKLSNLVNQSYWVGDPKQSIYGFRGSDPVLINEIMKQFSIKNDSNLTVEMLKMSWRSSLELVHLGNELFSESLKDQIAPLYIENKEQLLGSDQSESFRQWKESVEIHPIIGKETISLFPARTIDQNIKGCETIQFWNFLQNGAKALRGASNAQYHNSLSNQIKQLLEQDIEIYDKNISKHRKLKGSDICLLFSTNTNVGSLSKELLKVGLKVNAVTDGLLDTLEYRFLKNCISLLLQPSASLANAEMALLTAHSKSLESLFKDRFDYIEQKAASASAEDSTETFSDYWLKSTPFNEKIVQLREHIKGFSVVYSISFIINQFNFFLELTNFGSCNLRRANLLRFIEIAKEYEDSCLKNNIGSSLFGFLNFVEQNTAYQQQAVATDEDAIQLMTYHKSKGLEWPIVFLADLEKDYFADSEFYRKVFFKERVKYSGQITIEKPLENRYIEFLFWPFGSAQSPNSELMEELADTENYSGLYRETLDEKKRLLYVGITRARDGLVFASNSNKNLSWLEKTFNSFNWEETYTSNGLEPISATSFDLFQIGTSVFYEKFIFESEVVHPAVFEKMQYYEKYTPKLQESPYFISPSKAMTLDGCGATILGELHPRLKFKNVEPDTLGNVLHQMLYLKNKPSFTDDVSRLNLNNGIGIDEVSFIENVSLFKDYLAKNFDVIKEFREIHLEHPKDGQHIIGEADLVLETAEGLILIDYKSFPGKKEDILNNSSTFYAGKYSGQLYLYAEMLENQFNKPVLKKLIYYVVQGILVEMG
jgi:ATP-dependent helicase/nuclease subunit A